MHILEAHHLTKTYAIDGRSISVLNDVSMTVSPGEFVVIQGASGSGKSTLISLLSGLDRPTSGRVCIAGEDITDRSEDQLAPLRNRTFGFVFQSFHLVPSLNALENVMFPAELTGDPKAEQKATALLERVGLADRMHNFPHQLSGGEKQRVAICRALVNEPQILFADEPTGNLDSKNSDAILALLAMLHRERATTLLLVTHSPEVAAMAGRTVTLVDGRVVSADDAPNLDRLPA
ncbi:MAG: ABC transporter ATP-binding protein [Caldilineaceae bacterium]|nr:ABC transporter ATP-binding protein [Caldilineaceae bacterium]